MSPQMNPKYPFMTSGVNSVISNPIIEKYGLENIIWPIVVIKDNKIRVFILPGFEIAREATNRADLQLRMQGNTFLGAFFKVSTLSFLKSKPITLNPYS